ncbi:hypothetical protein EDEG_01598 [Edhazardia aedis USNM 41457]|uniref:Uncharacterized protein n=1 Tax=Edhazardia aedis (strain USNM 41457) TaxID=1003232 RepID=J8ZWT2_EDHAE|nr:hypothetical protein EDEG_01598 [Edhazardia aedis USNM 41457]|eukprot:EJW04118.2 hypothetical protein EDEG_01598 [Edhazardia aedis USNM 41457]
MPMLFKSDTIKKIGNLIITSLNEYEKFCIKVLRFLSHFRTIFYSLFFFIICKTYLNSVWCTYFATAFIITSVLQLISQKFVKNISVKKILHSILQGFMVTSSVIMVIFISQSVKFLIHNFTTIRNNIRTLISIQRGTYRTIMTILSILSIPLSAIAAVTSQIYSYMNLPVLNNKFNRVNIFTGRQISEEKQLENMEFPLGQLSTVFINFLTNNGVLCCFKPFIDILTPFVDYAGDKRHQMLFPMVLSTLLTLFLGVVKFCDFIKCPLVINEYMNPNVLASTCQN